jgi:outer membrane protein assembly factor BamB
LVAFVGIATTVHGVEAGDGGAREICAPPGVPAGVVNPDGSAFFVTNAEGRVEAVDLKTGKTLWESSAAQRPLAIVGNKLIAQAKVKKNGLAIRLVLLDLKNDGKLLKESEELSTGPPELDVNGYSGLRSEHYTFKISATVVKDAAIVRCEWTSSWSVIKGAAPAPGEVSDGSFSAWRIWRLDLDSAKVKTLASDTDSKGSEVPNILESLQEAVKAGVWDKPSIADLKLAGPANVELAADGKTVVIVDKAHAVLLSAVSGKHLAEVDLKGSASVQVTPDGQTVIISDQAHVLLLTAASGKQLADVDKKGATPSVHLISDGRALLIASPSESDKSVYHAVLFNTASGKQISEIDVKCGKDLEIEQVSGIVGKWVYTTTAGQSAEGKVGTNTVLAFDAASGEGVWSKSYSNRIYAVPKFRGPYPP